ncbi:ANR family transcriptional regulator [Pasteurella skyensis]|uniref:ANR family transcriptional regulator n=1 Tax=Phocoenobacter skyensis TaxID=97481 RepID=A0AAJ6NEN2_9PAST|nr:ANR family transcriptional regulator [Pasteurella skyensis]MDP8171521.1 ANR family transcriptional regulator [Pasteurella skyensis]MDP8175423.1 ANR family transcriptional regulator [Pasteurella skyensis]
MSGIVQSANATIKKQLDAERKATYIYVAKQARDIENQKNERYLEAVNLWRKAAKLARNYKNRIYALNRAEFLEAWGERIYQREKQGL